MRLWVARDQDGSLWLYNSKPENMGVIYSNGNRIGDSLFVGNIFPEVTFENSPMEIELKLVEK